MSEGNQKVFVPNVDDEDSQEVNHPVEENLIAEDNMEVNHPVEENLIAEEYMVIDALDYQAEDSVLQFEDEIMYHPEAYLELNDLLYPQPAEEYMPPFFQVIEHELLDDGAEICILQFNDEFMIDSEDYFEVNDLLEPYSEDDEYWM